MTHFKINIVYTLSFDEQRRPVERNSTVIITWNMAVEQLNQSGIPSAVATVDLIAADLVALRNVVSSSSVTTERATLKRSKSSVSADALGSVFEEATSNKCSTSAIDG